MTTITRTFSNAEIFAILNLSVHEPVNFSAEEIPDALASSIAQAYFDMLVKQDLEVPHGRELQVFATRQVIAVKNELIANPPDPTIPDKAIVSRGSYVLFRGFQVVSTR